MIAQPGKSDPITTVLFPASVQKKKSNSLQLFCPLPTNMATEWEKLLIGYVRAFEARHM